MRSLLPQEREAPPLMVWSFITSIIKTENEDEDEDTSGELNLRGNGEVICKGSDCKCQQKPYLDGIIFTWIGVVK